MMPAAPGALLLLAILGCTTSSRNIDDEEIEESIAENDADQFVPVLEADDAELDDEIEAEEGLADEGDDDWDDEDDDDFDDEDDLDEDDDEDD
jgi:hypothetical protein